jgi:hypothetical protein
MHRYMIACAAGAMLALGAVGACGPKEVYPYDEPSISMILANPQDNVGKPLEASGVVRYVHRPGVFVISDINAPADEIVVVSDGPVPPNLAHGDVVRVVGRVTTFRAGSTGTYVGPRYGTAQEPVEDATFYRQYVDTPAIAASGVERLVGGVPPGTPEPQPPMGGVGGSTGQGVGSGGVRQGGGFEIPQRERP